MHVVYHIPVIVYRYGTSTGYPAYSSDSLSFLFNPTKCGRIFLSDVWKKCEGKTSFNRRIHTNRLVSGKRSPASAFHRLDYQISEIQRSDGKTGRDDFSWAHHHIPCCRCFPHSQPLQYYIKRGKPPAQSIPELRIVNNQIKFNCFTKIISKF